MVTRRKTQKLENMTSAKTLKLLMNRIFELATLKIALEKQMERQQIVK